MSAPIRMDPEHRRQIEITTPDGVVTVTVGSRSSTVIVYGRDGVEEIATVRLRRDQG